VKKNHFILLILVFQFGFINAQSPDTMFVNLEHVMKLAGVNSLQIQEFEKKYELSVAEHKKTREWLLPEIYAGINSHQLSGTTINSDGRFFTDVKQNYIWYGGGAKLIWDFGEGIFRSKEQDYLSKAALHRSKVARNQEILRSIQLFYQLQSSQVKSLTLQILIDKSENITAQIEAQVKSGFLNKTEILMAKSNHNQLRIELFHVQKQLKTNRALLAEQLDIDQEIILKTGDLMIPFNLLGDSISYEINNYEQRPEYRLVKEEILALKMGRKAHTLGHLLPVFQLDAYLINFGASFSTTDPTNAVVGGLMWRIPIGKLIYAGDKKTYDAKIQIKEIQLDQITHQIDREISSLKSELLLSKQQLQLAEQSLEYSREALQLSTVRQKARTAQPLEVFQAQQYYIKAQNSFIEAVRDYNTAQFMLFVALGNDL